MSETLSALSAPFAPDALSNRERSAPERELPEYIRLTELQRSVPFSDAHLGRLEKAGLFPKRIKFGPSRVVWDLAEILAWIEARRAASGKAPTTAE